MRDKESTINNCSGLLDMLICRISLLECGSITLVSLFEDMQCWLVFVVFNKHSGSIRGKCSELDTSLVIFTSKCMKFSPC